MAWTSDDVARSLKRYLALTLDGPPWRIRTERREVRDDERPVAVIDLGQQTPIRMREGTPHQGEIEWLVPVTITAYPARNEDQQAGRQDAELLRHRLFQLIAIGIAVTNVDGRNFGGPFRIPLWDWNDVSLTGATKGDAGDPLDCIWVPSESLDTRIAQDPEDTRRYAVIVEFRATVEAPGAWPVPEPPVATFDVSGASSGLGD